MSNEVKETDFKKSDSKVTSKKSNKKVVKEDMLWLETMTENKNEPKWLSD